MKSKFAKGLLIYVLVMLVIIFAGLFVFWRFIAAYELSRTDGAMDRYMETALPAELEQAITDFVAGRTDFESEEAQTRALGERLSVGTLTYRKDPERFAEEAPMYLIRLDKQVIGTVELKSEPGGLFSFGLSRWDVRDAEFDLGVFAKTYTVTAPEEADITVNGVRLTEANCDVELGLPAVLEPYAGDLGQQPGWVNYSFTAVALPEVRVVSASDDYWMSRDEAADVFTVTLQCDSELSAELTAYAEAFVRAYIAYTSNAVDGPGVVQQYLVPGSSMYERMTASMDGMSWVHGVTSTMSELQIVGYEYYGSAAVLEANYVLTSNGVATDNDMKIILTLTDSGWRVANIELL